jgi:ADP-heptose:LPS heptosyltransferase
MKIGIVLDNKVNKWAMQRLKHIKVLVTGDTGTMHLAIALGIPVVALFAVSDPKRSGPYYDNDRHIVIKKERA